MSPTNGKDIHGTFRITHILEMRSPERVREREREREVEKEDDKIQNLIIIQDSGKKKRQDVEKNKRQRHQ